MLLALLLTASSMAGPRICLTPQMLQMRDIGWFGGFRPASVGYVDSAVYPVRVHYSNPADLTRVQTVVIPAMEEIWYQEIEVMGWPAPPSDNGEGGSDAYDIYLEHADTFGGAYTWGWGPDATLGDNWFSMPTYIAVDDRPNLISDADMPTYLAHEFNHASQYTIDAMERTLFVWEATAEAITDIVYDSTDYGYELPSFQMLPFQSLLFDSYNPALAPFGYTGWYYEYGGMLFATYLEERFGTKDGTVLLQLWDDLAQDNAVDEPDFLDALALVDPAFPTAGHVYADFAVWRMFASINDDGAHYEEGADWDTDAIVRAEAEIPLSTLDGTVESPTEPPYMLGANYWEIDLEAGTSQWLHVDVAGDPGTRWGIAWAVWPASGAASTGWVLVDDGDPLATEFDLDGGVRAEVAVINAGPADLDPNDDPVTRGNYTVTFSLVDAPVVDTGTATGTGTGTGGTATGGTGGTGTGGTGTGTGGDDFVDDGSGEKGGCACDDTGGSGSALALAVGLLAIRRRR